MSIYFQPIWFDSMGAKSSCAFIKTPDLSIVLDPGISIMQPSFPASPEKKAEWMARGYDLIKEVCKKADYLSISHYHYDHYFPDDINIYKGKKIFIKNPNEYINIQQRHRAEEFFNSIFDEFNIAENEKKYQKKRNSEYQDPIENLPIASSKDFGTYNKRRREVLEKGKKRFNKLSEKWLSNKSLPEIKSKDIEIIFPEEKRFRIGDTTIKFTQALFHGIEYAGVGWVYATIIEYKDKRLLHSSDVNGPMIEDYAELIINENPSILILDGPMTYLYGYILNRINLKRTIDNTIDIIQGIDSDIIIYDHHLTRENRFREHTKEIWDKAKELKKKVMTAAEYLGQKTVVETTKYNNK